MKKIIAYIGSYLFYSLGHMSSLLMKLYPGFWSLYQKLMVTSIKIQDWAGLDKPWKRI